MLKRLVIIVAIGAAGLAWYSALPPAPRIVPMVADGLAPPVRGAIHVHTERSDGTGTVAEVAAAAARAGLRFVILTDHGDGTREPLAPAYLDNILIIDAVEVSTDQGHAVALDLPVSPYPIAGEARDAVEDIARLGGFAIAAHPASAKPTLRWADWTAPVGGLEWLNGDSEWRDESRWMLARVLFTYPFRASATLTTLLDRPDALLKQWDELTGGRPVVAVAASDAHSRIGARTFGEPYENTASLHVPSYEEMFRTFSIALPDVALGSDPAADARAVVNAIRTGHVYSVVDGVAAPAVMRFTATSGGATAAMGEMLAPQGEATLIVDAQIPTDGQIQLLRNGEIVARGPGPRLEHRSRETGAYRVEIALPGAPGEPPVPWILSNPIYVGAFYVGRTATEQPQADPRAPATQFVSTYVNGPADDWTVETSPSSKGALDVVRAVGGTQLSLRFALGGAASANPFVAAAMPAGAAISNYNRLVFTARATQPMRVSVQFRVPGGDVGQRWHRSVYVDSTPRTVTVHFDDLTPRGPTATRRPTIGEVQTILWVVDTVNTPLGASGEMWIDDVKYGR